MEYDYSKLGLSTQELFSRQDHSDLESEKITAPRYSYWQSVFNVFFRKKLNACQQQMNEGKDLTDALFASGIFTGMYARMASIGAKTGSMDQVMDTIASLYQDNIDNRMNNILATLEPTLVILLSLIVGVILLSVMLPLMGIMSSL